MQPELEYYSTSELIDELMRRRTFLGVIVHAAEELKQPQWNDERVFRVHFNGNLDSTQAGKLLEKVASRIDAPAISVLISLREMTSSRGAR